MSDADTIRELKLAGDELAEALGWCIAALERRERVSKPRLEQGRVGVLCWHRIRTLAADAS